MCLSLLLSACLYFILLFKQNEEIIHVSCELVPWNKNEERTAGECEVLLRDVEVETSFYERAVGNHQYTSGPSFTHPDYFIVWL